MAAFDQETLERWRALAIVDRDGNTVGTINEFYLDRETGHPTWALVSTGLFGGHRTFVPLVHATEISDGLQVPYEKDHIKDAPRVDLHDELSPDEEAVLFAHYGVEYQVAEPVPVEGPGPVPATPAGTGSDQEADAEIGAAEAPQAEGGPGATSPTGTGAEPGTGEAPGPVREEPGPAGATEAEARSGPPDSSEVVPDEPGTDETTGDRYDVGADAPDRVPDEPGTAGPDEAGRVGPSGSGPEETERHGDGPAAELPDRAGRDGGGLVARHADPAAGDPDRFRTLPGDPDLSRTAPVEPGLPGSTAASRYGYPTTVAKDADPSEGSVEEPLRPPGEPGWSPGAAGSFEAAEPIERPAGSSDRWREAKLAAERDRIARAAAAQPEERSPLERARRRLERLVGGGQEHSDPDPVSPAERDAAERARRARLCLDEDDNRRR
jgi:PRC-barrel domain protein